jgi:hypothetical protein
MEQEQAQADALTVSRMFHRDYRRQLLHEILDSLIHDVETAERQGVYLFDWNISVKERGPLQPIIEEIDDEIEPKL